MRIVKLMMFALALAPAAVAAQTDTTRCTWEGRLPTRGGPARITAGATTVRLSLDQLATGSKVERQQAARALGETGDPAALAPLRRALSDPNTHVVVEAVWALGRFGRSDLEPVLLETLTQPDEHVMQAAACSLGRVGTTAALPALRGLLESTNPFVASAAAWSIREIERLPNLPRE